MNHSGQQCACSVLDWRESVTRLRMNGDMPALPHYAFMAWRGSTLPLPLCLLSTMRDAALHILSSRTDTRGEFGLFEHTFCYI